MRLEFALIKEIRSNTLCSLNTCCKGLQENPNAVRTETVETSGMTWLVPTGHPAAYFSESVYSFSEVVNVRLGILECVGISLDSSLHYVFSVLIKVGYLELWDLGLVKKESARP